MIITSSIIISISIIIIIDKAAVVRLYPDPPPFFTSGCGRVLPAPAQTRSGERTRGQAHLEPGKARNPLGAAASRRKSRTRWSPPLRAVRSQVRRTVPPTGLEHAVLVHSVKAPPHRVGAARVVR